jgi:PASTA domain-containing protein
MRWPLAALFILVSVALLSGCGGSDGTTVTQEPTASMPNLLGKSARSASRELRQRGVRPHFTAIGDPAKGGSTSRCAGVPPDGHIVDFDYPPGSPLRPGQRVDLQTSCPPPEALHACSPQDLRLHVSADYPDASGGIVQPGFSLTNARATPCAVTGSAEVAIENPDGSLIDAPGNPVITEIRHRIAGPGESLGNGFSWRSWCGPRGKYLLLGRFATLSTIDRVHVPSECDKGDDYGRLDPFGERVGQTVTPRAYRLALNGDYAKRGSHHGLTGHN